VPDTVAAHIEVCAVVMEAGVAATTIEVMVNVALVTVMGAEPDTFVYPACVDVALQLPLPVPDGVKTPPAVIVPPVAVHVTAELYAPVPATVATQVAVCPVVIDEGVAITVIPVTVMGGAVAVTVIFAEPDTFVYPVCVDVALQLPVPVPEGVNTPPAVIVPPVAVHVTAEL
jgi:hypothetical protein